MEYSEWDERWECTFDDLKGRTLISVVRLDDSLIFTDTEDTVFQLLHQQDCCESVYIESIVGDLSDLLETPILLAEEASNSNDGEVPAKSLIESYDWEYEGEGEPPPIVNKPDSYTWSFYKLATIKGYVDIRFFGTSNGCYSEKADLICLKYKGVPCVE